MIIIKVYIRETHKNWCVLEKQSKLIFLKLANFILALILQMNILLSCNIFDSCELFALKYCIFLLLVLQ